MSLGHQVMTSRMYCRSTLHALTVGLDCNSIGLQILNSGLNIMHGVYA